MYIHTYTSMYERLFKIYKHIYIHTFIYIHTYINYIWVCRFSTLLDVFFHSKIILLKNIFAVLQNTEPLFRICIKLQTKANSKYLSQLLLKHVLVNEIEINLIKFSLTFISITSRWEKAWTKYRKVYIFSLEITNFPQFQMLNRGF